MSDKFSGICHELFAIAQSPRGIDSTVSVMEKVLSDWFNETNKPLVEAVIAEIDQLKGTVTWVCQADRQNRLLAAIAKATGADQ